MFATDPEAGLGRIPPPFGRKPQNRLGPVTARLRTSVMGRIGRQGLDVESCFSIAAQPESQPHLSSGHKNYRRNSAAVITLAEESSTRTQGGLRTPARRQTRIQRERGLNPSKDRMWQDVRVACMQECCTK